MITTNESTLLCERLKEREQKNFSLKFFSHRTNVKLYHENIIGNIEGTHRTRIHLHQHLMTSFAPSSNMDPGSAISLPLFCRARVSPIVRASTCLYLRLLYTHTYLRYYTLVITKIHFSFWKLYLFMLRKHSTDTFVLSCSIQLFSLSPSADVYHTRDLLVNCGTVALWRYYTRDRGSTTTGAGNVVSCRDGPLFSRPALPLFIYFYLYTLYLCRSLFDNTGCVT